MLTKQAKTDYQREYMKRKRSNKEIVLDPVRPTDSVRPVLDPEKYPHIVHVLADPKKRDALRKKCESLNSRSLFKEVRFGVNGPTMEQVAEYLTAFKD